MKRTFLKSFALILALVMALSMLAACNTAPEKTAEEQVEEQVEETAPSAKVTIQADGKEFIIVDADGKTVSDLLKDAGVTLGEGDVVSVDPDQVFGGDMTVKVLRKCAVTVTRTTKTPWISSTPLFSWAARLPTR
ncbi:MAG: ubiquitin-like domain-containing protein [Oscillospiraceae bacterium]|nr:ubiquitin-like domain-containing protein [Oscillospiraceae bacterium]